MNASLPPMKVWVGETFNDLRIFVLGESWYGDFPDDLVTDDGYIRAYLTGRVTDPLYTRIANATGLSRQQFWQSVMFTNFVQRVGSTRTERPTPAMYAEAKARLAELLQRHRPLGVWIIGIEQARHSAAVVESAGIACEVSPHPSSYGVKTATLHGAWAALLGKTATRPTGQQDGKL